MSNNSPITGLIENEKILRRSNERAQKRVKHDFTAVERARTSIHFYCECSNIPCKMRIPLNESEYEAIHNDRDKFILVKGHEVAGVERVVAEHEGYVVVEKYALQP